MSVHVLRLSLFLPWKPLIGNLLFLNRGSLSGLQIKLIFFGHLRLFDTFNLILQLLLDLLNFSAASFSAVAKYPISRDKELVVITERFVLEQLNLAKELISENKVLLFYTF